MPFDFDFDSPARPELPTDPASIAARWEGVNWTACGAERCNCCLVFTDESAERYLRAYHVNACDELPRDDRDHVNAQLAGQAPKDIRALLTALKEAEAATKTWRDTAEAKALECATLTAAGPAAMLMDEPNIGGVSPTLDGAQRAAERATGWTLPEMSRSDGG